jgi:TP901 family phage tail tape measure protein
MNLGNLIARLGVDTTGLRAAANSLNKFERESQTTMRRVNKTLEDTGKKMKQFGRNMSLYVTAPIALVGRGAFNMYKDFESSMTKIVGLVGVAREQVDQWSRDILEMAPRLGKAPAELADALFFVTSAGIRGAEAMDVLEMSAKASAAGLGETKIVADLVTSAMNAYGVANLSAAEATDVLVATVREGKAQADALAGAMGRVLPIASYMGVTFDQVGGAIAAMTRTGTDASTAAIQLRQILNSLIKPSQQAEEALIDMGMSAAELRKTVREDGLLTALLKVRELTNKFGEDTVAKVFPNIRALSGILDIMGKNLDDNVKIFASVEKAAGSLDVAFGEASDTLEFRWNQAVNSTKVALTELGGSLKTALVPILRSVVERVRRVVDWFRSLNESTQQMIIRVAALAAAIGPLSVVLGLLVGNVLPGLIKVVRVATVAFTRFTVALLTNPLVLLATVLAGVVVGLTALARHLKEAKKAQEEFNGISEKAMQTTIEQRGAVEQLFSIAKNEKKSIEERTAALKALHRASKQYFGDLTLENIATERGAKAKEAYIAEILREAKVKAAQEEIVRLEKERYRKIEELEGARLKFGQKVGATLLGAFAGQARASVYVAQKGMENIKKVEAELDAAQERIKTFFEEIVTPEDIQKLFGGDIVVEDATVTQAGKIGLAMKTLGEELAYASKANDLLGGSFDRSSFLIETYQSAIEELLRAGLDPADEKVQDLKRSLDQLQESKKFVDEVSKAMDNLLIYVDKDWEQYVEGIGIAMNRQSVELTSDIDDIILGFYGLERAAKKTTEEFAIGPAIAKNAFQGMSNVISDALGETQGVLKAFGKFFSGFIKGMIIKLVAATIAATALAVVLSLIGGGAPAKVFSVLKEGAKFGEIFKQGFKSFTGLQKGGVVPPGYPNDSFPALLSSGERVLPAGQGPVTFNPEELVFRIEGDDLVAVWRKKMSVARNY